MSRWQVVDRVRELSTKAVKSGAEGSKIKIFIYIQVYLNLFLLSSLCFFSGFEEFKVCPWCKVLSNGGSGEIQGGMSENI